MTEALAKQLLAHLLGGAGSSPRLSVIGLSKNAGKTVTLNHLIRAAAAQKLTLGLVSTGRDGEQEDAVTELPKPRIWAPTGTWVATAKGALEACTARIDIFRELPVSTPFGPVIIGRVARAGEVLLIGPGSVKKVAELLGALESMGARFCMVDGSFDRIAAAAPTVTGRVVLAAGAAYSTSMGETVAQVRHVLDVFDTPAVLPAIQATVEKAVQIAPVCVVTLAGAIYEVKVPSALGNPELIADALAAQQANGAYLVLNGALSDRLVMTLLRRRINQAHLVVNDPTHVLVERNLWRRWRRFGGQVFARRRVELLAVTTNPYSPVGQPYDASEFFEAVRAIAGRPVFDLEYGLPRP